MLVLGVLLSMIKSFLSKMNHSRAMSAVDPQHIPSGFESAISRGYGNIIAAEKENNTGIRNY